MGEGVSDAATPPCALAYRGCFSPSSLALTRLEADCLKAEVSKLSLSLLHERRRSEPPGTPAFAQSTQVRVVSALPGVRLPRALSRTC